MAIREELYDDTGAQMELAGLVSEPTDVDPVSGNEIPVGATAEGVRDDQTASISPGEFVIPDYAVRYHGLDFYVDSLQKAQHGLDQMEDMGLVGNPDEQTVPDETPLPSMEEEGMPPQEMPEEAGTEQAMSDTGEPMPTTEFQTGGLATVPIYSPTQQATTAPPIAPPPVQPIRPISTQPVPITGPAIQQPAAPLLTQYQQGYYIETGGGYYRYQGPPGTSTTQQVYTRDQLPAGAVVAPAGTKYSDVWGTTPGQGFSKQSPYLALQGSAAGLPGGYKVEAYKDAQGNIVYLTTVGGKVQGGIPPGYTKASQEDLGFGAPRQEPKQAATITQPPRPTGPDGAGPDDFGTDVPGPPGDKGKDQASWQNFSDATVTADLSSMSISEMFSAANNAAEQAYGTGEKGTQKGLGTLMSLAAPMPMKAFSLVAKAPMQNVMAAMQAKGLAAISTYSNSNQNTMGVGNFNVMGQPVAVYAPHPTFPNVLVSNHSDISVQDSQNFAGYMSGFSSTQMQNASNNFTFSKTSLQENISGMSVSSSNATPDLVGDTAGPDGTVFSGSTFDFNEGVFFDPVHGHIAHTTQEDFASKHPALQAAIRANQNNNVVPSKQEQARLTALDKQMNRGRKTVTTKLAPPTAVPAVEHTPNIAADKARAAERARYSKEKAIQEDIVADYSFAPGTTGTIGMAPPGGYGGGGDPDGPSPSYICTATYDAGLITTPHFKSLRKYGIDLRRNDPYLMKAYDMFGPILARYVNKNKGTKYIARFLTDYYRDIVNNKPLNTKQKIFKVISNYILRPTYRTVGWISVKL